MRTRLSFTIGLLILALCIMNGQSIMERPPVYSHAVYRADGSVLKGEIVGWTEDKVTLRLLSGVDIRIDTEDIYKIISKRVPKPARQERISEPRSYGFKEDGLYHVTTIGMSAGPAAGLGVTHAIGYRFSRILGAGVGVGAESFDLGAGNQIVPLFAEARGFFLKNNISPYYALRVGYGFAIKSAETNVTEARGGTMLGFELGYRFGGTRAVNFFTGVGVHFQNATYIYDWPWSERFTDEIHHRRTELKFGVIF